MSKMNRKKFIGQCMKYGSVQRNAANAFAEKCRNFNFPYSTFLKYWDKPFERAKARGFQVGARGSFNVTCRFGKNHLKRERKINREAIRLFFEHQTGGDSRDQ